MDSPSSHNSFYVDKDITAWYQDGSLWDRIAGRNGYSVMEGIYPGCYFETSRQIKINNEDSASLIMNNQILILGINSKMNSGAFTDGLKVNYNHIVCCPMKHFGKAKMIETETISGGYNSCNMNVNILGSPTTTGNIAGTINEQLYAEFGDHLKTLNESLSTRINSTSNINNYPDEVGATAGFKMSNTYVQSLIMSEIEVFGASVYSSNGLDVGTGNCQFPAFRLCQERMILGTGYALRNIASNTRFAYVSNNGSISTVSGTQSDYVRPRFVLA